MSCAFKGRVLIWTAYIWNERQGSDSVECILSICRHSVHKQRNVQWTQASVSWATLTSTGHWWWVKCEDEILTLRSDAWAETVRRIIALQFLHFQNSEQFIMDWKSAKSYFWSIEAGKRSGDLVSTPSYSGSVWYLVLRTYQTVSFCLSVRLSAIRL